MPCLQLDPMTGPFIFTQQRLANRVLDGLADGAAGRSGALLDLGEQVIVDRDRGSHASQHTAGASRCTTSGGDAAGEVVAQPEQVTPDRGEYETQPAEGGYQRPAR